MSEARLPLLEREGDTLMTAGIRALVGGGLDEADRAFRQVLDAFPEHAQAHALRGAVAHRRGDLEAARQHLERATTAAPSPEHLCNLAMVLAELGQLTEAERHLRRALGYDPAHVEARVNLGTVLMRTARPEEALTHFDRAVALKPNLAPAHWQTSGVLRMLGRPVEALEALRRFRALVPTDADAATASAQLMRDLGDVPGSAAAFREALTLDPHASPAVRMELLFTLRQLCAWDEAAPLLAELLQSASCEDLGGWVAPFFELSLPLSPERLLNDARKHARDITGLIVPAERRAAKPLGGRRLRVGYVSADFREHPLSHLMRGFFAQQDRTVIEAFVYALSPDDGSTYRAAIAGAAEHFVDLSSADIDACVARIRKDEIDVLVDLMGYTFWSRFPIFAHRCAPVQATYMGFAGTLGSDAIDYQIVDKTIVPPALAPFYSERLVYLPDTYMVTDDTQEISARTPARTECDLPVAGIVFACFNVAQKIEPEVFGAWMRIMTRVPESVLWLLTMAEDARENLRQFAAAHGVAPERLVFAPRWKKARHLARLRLADVVLDTFYFGAHTTAVDALWAGVPVVTLPGATFASRVGASVVGAMGLPELIAESPEAYEAIAVRLAGDSPWRDAIRRRLAENRTTHPLFDTRRFTRHFEHALGLMHDAAVAGATAKVIDVPKR